MKWHPALGQYLREMALLRFCGRDIFARWTNIVVILSLNVSIMYMAFHFNLKNGINRIGTSFCCIVVRSKRHARSKSAKIVKNREESI